MYITETSFFKPFMPGSKPVRPYPRRREYCIWRSLPVSDAISAPVFFDPGFYGWLSINPFFGIKMPALLLFQVFRLFTGLLPGLIRD